MASFKSILLPVNLDLSTELIIKRAIELIEPNDSTIHLLHIVKPTSNWNILSTEGNYIENFKDGKHYNYLIEKRLSEWKVILEELLGCTVGIHIMAGGHVQNNIIKAALKLKPGLIIFGDSTNKWFPIIKKASSSQIAKKTNCAVLTVKAGTINNKIRSIVLPMKNFISAGKIELTIELARKYRSSVHLLRLKSEPKEAGEDSSYSFLQSFRVLKNELNVPIECHLLRGTNLAKATIEYTKNINADILLIDSAEEMHISSPQSMHINNVLTKYSISQPTEAVPNSQNGNSTSSQLQQY